MIKINSETINGKSQTLKVRKIFTASFSINKKVLGEKLIKRFQNLPGLSLKAIEAIVNNADVTLEITVGMKIFLSLKLQNELIDIHILL